MKLDKLLLICIMLIGIWACEEATVLEGWGEQEDIILTDYIESKGGLSITFEALSQTYLLETLSTYGPYTVLCPTNSAWQKYFEANNYNSISDVDSLTINSIFEYQVLPFEMPLENLENGPMAEADTTIGGQRLLVDISQGLDEVIINTKATITNGNIKTWNGIVHETDAVLDPPVSTAKEYLLARPETYSKFVEFLDSEGVLDTLGLKYSTEYPYKLNQFTIFALSNEAMDTLAPRIEQLKEMDANYEAEVAKDPDYANKVLPNQVHQLARSFVLQGVDYASTMYSGYKRTIAKVPYGDGTMRMKVVQYDDHVLINDFAKVFFDVSDNVVQNGLIHRCNEAFDYLNESPQDLIYSAAPAERWITYNGAIASVNSKNGYIGDMDDVYGITNLEPGKTPGGEFEIRIPQVQAGRYTLTLITKKQGSKATITVDDKLLNFPGTEEDGSYDFAYILGNRGRVDNRDPNPTSADNLYLYEIPTSEVVVGEDQDYVSVKLKVTRINQAGGNIAISALILEPLAE